MADVLVIQPRHAAAFELGAFPLAIPVDGDDVAVGVERGKENQHHVAQRAEHLGIVRGRERMQQFRRGLRRGDFGGVNAHADRDDHRLPLAIASAAASPGTRGSARRKRVEANLFEPGEVFRRRHDRGDQPSSFGRRPGIDDVDAIGSGGDGFEVSLQARPVGELAIGAHPVAERGFRSRHRYRRLGQRRG